MPSDRQCLEADLRAAFTSGSLLRAFVTRTRDEANLMEAHSTAGLISSRRLPIGAETSDDGTHFRVWAPRCRRVELILSASNGQIAENRPVALHAEDRGYFSVFAPGISAGARYGFRVDHEERILPDPASRFQPDGPEGLSQLIDPTRFRWTDNGWRGVRPSDQVIYEMHIGTFTREGTWRAASRELEELARMGITVLEIMPVGDFAGEFGWGYDGVNLFAPTRLYGTPDDFRQFVDLAHAAKLGVILDVVYNHFGPVGNYVPMFSDHFRSEKHNTDWGDAINFDGEQAISVREFFRSNVRYWIQEFHLDGVRFDATQDIHDDSQKHVLAELVS